MVRKKDPVWSLVSLWKIQLNHIMPRFVMEIRIYSTICSSMEITFLHLRHWNKTILAKYNASILIRLSIQEMLLTIMMIFFSIAYG